MSKAVIQRLSAQFGDRVLETRDFRGDEEAVVDAKDWVEVARFLRDDDATAMDHLVDLTAVDWPERGASGPRFDVLLSLRSTTKKHRVRVVTRVAEGASVPTLVEVYAGTNWAEREVWDMFGVRFEGHPDLRRILLYEAFEGHPLRKDYPIEQAQPLVAYRDVRGVTKLPPFGVDEGQPFARIDWRARLAGAHSQVSPALGMVEGQRRTLSDSEAAQALAEKIARTLGETADPAKSEE